MTEQAGSTGRRREEDGPVIPDRSADDEDVGWGDEDGSDRLGDGPNDERLRRERPPHW
ncbi:MAG: hypothetical protein ACLGIA_10065 [Actinomycetes bacterium]